MDNDLIDRAEQAVLGAMITDQRLAAQFSYLVPEDFTDLRHRWVFTTVRQLSTTPRRVPGSWRELIEQATGRWVTREHLDGLAAACPDARHSPAYGAMLVQAAVYRQVRDHADQMDVQAAQLRTEGSRLSEAGAHAAGQAAELGALLTQTAKAVRGHTAALAPAAHGTAGGTAPGHPERPTTLAQEREEFVLSAVLRGHPQAGQILSFLPAAAFTSPERQEIFRAARRLSQSGRPIDELTVSWELATRYAVTVVVSPERALQPQVPDSDIGRLARTDVGAGRQPLHAAQDLDAWCRYRAARGTGPAARADGKPSPGGQAQTTARGPVQAHDPSAMAVVVPLIRPQSVAEGRPAGPKHRR